MRRRSRSKPFGCRTVAIFAGITLLVGLPTVAEAGMPSLNLTDLGRMRLSALSFFVAGFLVSSWGIQRLWNLLQRDFPRLPRLTYKVATGVVFLWGMLFVLVLTMISGARELMTPGAWEKQGLTYKLADADATADGQTTLDDTLPLRRELQLQKLHGALLKYADEHDGHFPPHEGADAMEPGCWNLPDRLGIRYRYVPGRTAQEASKVIAYEPKVYDDRQLGLWTDGRVESMTVAQLEGALGAGDAP